MRRSTTFGGTDTGTGRRALLSVLLAEFVCAIAVLNWPTAAPGAVPTAAPAVAHDAAPRVDGSTLLLPDGRTAHLLNLGGARATSLLTRVSAELDGAADAVTAFWGPRWRRDIVIVASGTSEQFRFLGGGGSDIAAATTRQRIVFAPGAADMSSDDLRIVLRHELFHYAARDATAPDAPRWLTEGVADYVGRPPVTPADADQLTVLPTDTDLDTAGARRSLAYDRAWWFSRFVADRYGVAALRALYVRACGAGHPDVATAVHDALGVGLDAVLASWRQWTAR
jgi:hypothetical protein